MKGSITQFILLLLIVTSRSFTQAVSKPPDPDKDPFVGTWKANAVKSRPKLDKDEALYVRTISRDGDDRVISSRTKKPGPAPLIKGKTYSEFSEKNYRIRCDGLLHPVPCGVVYSCTMSCTYKTANRVEGETYLDCPIGNETCRTEGTSYWTEEVSADGQEMMVLRYSDKDRTELKRANVLDRVK